MSFDFAQAQNHLSKADPVLATIIARFGPCALQPQRQYFLALAEAILSQQLSVKAAATIFQRFKETLGGRITPDNILTLTDSQFRAVGVSRQKMAYLRDLAAKWNDGCINQRRFARMSDEEIVEALTQVKGMADGPLKCF
jgi:DNA-3-methyladenine glycosylase II